PTTSTQGSEAPGGVACQSEGVARLSVLRVVRQGVPQGCAGGGLRALPRQRRRTRDRPPDVRGHRGVWPGPLAGRTGGGIEGEIVPTSTGSARVQPQRGWQAKAAGIGAIRDRVAQMAVVLVLEPIFEADLEPEQYAYRANRTALDAVRQVHGLVNSGHTEVIDADLSGYFDSIPHPDLLKSLSRRISDRHLLGLIKVWLEAPVAAL